MPAVRPPFLEYEKNIHSQFGEDGVLARALSLLPARDNWCVEFGAWDGRYCSNTCALIEGQNYSAVLIEADPAKHAELKRSFQERKGVHALCRFVESEGLNTLDKILSETPIPKDFDLLSIDVDGMDYYLWEAVQTYRPKLVVIEYNPTIANDVEFVQPRDTRLTQGCSLHSLDKLAREKGYRLIHATLSNAIFVDAPYAEKLGVPESDAGDLRADLSCITHIFQTYDGRIHLHGNRRLFWHEGISMEARRMQALPGPLRRFPKQYGLFLRGWFKLFKAWRRLFGAGNNE